MIKKYRIILILFLIISIGYAVLTSNLNINGTFDFSESKWDVHFENIIVSEESLEADSPVINDSKDTVTFTGSFDKPGDFYEFSVDVFNAGTMDAVLNSIQKNELTEEQQKYINFTIRYYGNRETQLNDVLPAGYKERIIVRVEYKYDIEELVTFNNIDFSININYVKRNLHSDYNNEVWNLFYTGGEQVFTVPYDGEYLLETWGAQGGNAKEDFIGGYGAYSSGKIVLDKDDKLYINVGGQGVLCENDIRSGGYNGGGSCSDYAVNAGDDAIQLYASGGGATHIALTSGELKNLESFKGVLVEDLYYKSNDIIIIAGGGGGGGFYYDTYWDKRAGIGGSAGGYVGSTSSTIITNGNWKNTKLPSGATQLNGGISFFNPEDDFQSGEDGMFGQGGGISSRTKTAACGGGGGFYGGSGNRMIGGTGGSGYIANSSLNNKVMFCYNCEESNIENIKTISTTNVLEEPISQYAKIGNGHVKITFLG